MVWWQTLMVTLGGGASGVLSLQTIRLLIYKKNSEQMKTEIIPAIKKLVDPISLDVASLKKGFNEYSSMNKFEHKSIGRVLDRMGKQLDSVTDRVTIYDDNDAFYKSLCDIANAATVRVKQSKDAIDFINYQLGEVEKFSRWALTTGIRSISKEIFEGMAFATKDKGIKMAGHTISEEFAEEYFDTYGYLTEDYLKGIQKIKDDTINNIDKRFKAITFTFMSDISSTFANFYYAKYLQKNKENLN